MVFDVYSGLSDEYREYRIIEPENLNFRQPANDAERRTAASLVKTISKDARTIFIVGAVLIVLGIVVLINKQLGGIGLIMFGILPVVIGIIVNNKGKNSTLVSTGVLLKKESETEGTVSNKTRRTHRWLVIAVDDMEKTLSVVHADQDAFDEASEGDRILVINDKATSRGRKVL